MEVKGKAKGFIETIASVAPLLGRILPLPGGALIGDLIAHEFGGSTDDMDDLINKIKADPDAVIKLKQFELDHKLELQKIALQTYIAENQDRQNARQREIELLRAGRSDWVLPVLSMIITGGFFCCIAIIMLTVQDNSDRDILYMMLGVLGTAWTQVVSYYFGSSHREARMQAIANNVYTMNQARRKQDEDYPEDEKEDRKAA